MSYYGEWAETAMQDWRMRSEENRKNVLDSLGLPQDEAKFSWNLLDAETKDALIEACIDAAKDCGRDAYQMELDGGRQ